MVIIDGALVPTITIELTHPYVPQGFRCVLQGSSASTEELIARAVYVMLTTNGENPNGPGVAQQFSGPKLVQS
ncbi:MAG: hypothetical protein AB7R40_23120 [Nitrospiraceae bacterium]